MTASELIERLQRLREVIGGDPEVICQSGGCCYHGHEVIAVELGGEPSEHCQQQKDEAGSIVIRV